MKKYTKLYNIKYKNGELGPTEFLIDFEQFIWNKDVPVGPMNLNTKVAKAIREISSLVIESCSFDTVYLD